MKLIIEKVGNGYIITDKSDENRKTVIQAANYDNEIYTDAELLRMIKSLMGENTNKYSQYRMYINVLPGEDYEGKVDDVMKSDMDFMAHVCQRKIVKK